VIAGPDILGRDSRLVARDPEPLAEIPDDIVIHLVVRRHGARLRVGELHQLGIDGDRGEPIVRPVA
jgi:hypothetical protein